MLSRKDLSLEDPKTYNGDHSQRGSDATKKNKNKTKLGTAYKHRDIDCAFCQSGLRSSQKISKIHKCQHSLTLLKIQIRNVLLKWYRGSAEFILTSGRQQLGRLQAN